MALLLSLAFATAAQALESGHKYLMRGQVLDVQDNTLVVCIGRKDGAQAGQVLDVVRHERDPHQHKSAAPSFVRKDIGKVRITSIVDDHYAEATVIEGEIKVNDTVELQRD
jgi:hypothetical protein